MIKLLRRLFNKRVDGVKVPNLKEYEKFYNMHLETALWLACDITPMTNIDKAAKILAVKVWSLEKELGRIPTPAKMLDMNQ